MPKPSIGQRVRHLYLNLIGTVTNPRDKMGWVLVTFDGESCNTRCDRKNLSTQ